MEEKQVLVFCPSFDKNAWGGKVLLERRLPFLARIYSFCGNGRVGLFGGKRVTD